MIRTVNAANYSNWCNGVNLIQPFPTDNYRNWKENSKDADFIGTTTLLFRLRLQFRWISISLTTGTHTHTHTQCERDVFPLQTSFFYRACRIISKRQGRGVGCRRLDQMWWPFGQCRYIIEFVDEARNEMERLTFRWNWEKCVIWVMESFVSGFLYFTLHCG